MSKVIDSFYATGIFDAVSVCCSNMCHIYTDWWTNKILERHSDCFKLFFNYIYGHFVYCASAGDCIYCLFLPSSYYCVTENRWKWLWLRAFYKVTPQLCNEQFCRLCRVYVCASDPHIYLHARILCTLVEYSCILSMPHVTCAADIVNDCCWTHLPD